MSVRVAVVQQAGNHGQPAANLAKALDFAAQALAQGAELILFHEELLLGYCAQARELAEPVDGPTTQAFQALLRGRQALIVYGHTERAGEHCYISAPVVSAQGVIANYRKTHLWWDATGLRHEPSFYQPGEHLVTFPLAGLPTGLMICYDGDFPEMARAYARRGCGLLLWLNNRRSRGPKETHELAWRNSLFIASACCCGPDEIGVACGGGSHITGPDGKVLGELWDQEGLVIADIEPASALTQLARNPWFRGQRPELYGATELGQGTAASAPAKPGAMH